MILSAVSTFALSSSTNICVRALIKHFLFVSSPINLSKSSCTWFVNYSRKSKTLSVESVLILFSSKYSSSSLLISSKINVVSTSLSTYLFETKNIFSWCHFKIDQWYFRALISTTFSSFFNLKIYFWVFFCLKNLQFVHSIYCFSMLELKTLFKLSKSAFFKLVFHVMSCLFASFCLSDNVLDIWFFTYWFYCSKEVFSYPYLFPCFNSIITIIFTMFTCGNIKDHL